MSLFMIILRHRWKLRTLQTTGLEIAIANTLRRLKVLLSKNGASNHSIYVKVDLSLLFDGWSDFALHQLSICPWDRYRPNRLSNLVTLPR